MRLTQAFLLPQVRCSWLGVVKGKRQAVTSASKQRVEPSRSFLPDHDHPPFHAYALLDVSITASIRPVSFCRLGSALMYSIIRVHVACPSSVELLGVVEAVLAQRVSGQ